MAYDSPIPCVNRFLAVVREAFAALPADSRLLVCVSGGADSVALLHAAVMLKAHVVAVNCNFHLRGAESDRDSAFVGALCRKLATPLISLDFDTKAYCKRRHVSEEMACRELRYDGFRRLCRENGCARIVVAHNADDNIETMLLNLMRGTGLKGLCGMSADNGEIMRPLLRLTRREIEAFLTAINADHIEDSSNADDYYKRNFLRLRVLPLLEQKWPGVRKALTATIDNLRGACRVCDDAVAQALSGPAGYVDSAALDRFPDRRMLLHEAFAPVGASPAQLREMEATGREGAQWFLPEGVVTLNKDGFRYTANLKNELKCYFRLRQISNSQALADIGTVGADNATVFLAGVADDYEWQNPEPGMRIAPMGMKGTRKVADMLRDVRIPAPLRGSFPLLTDKRSGEIIWIPGVRRSRHRAVTEADSIVTQISATEDFLRTFFCR